MMAEIMDNRGLALPAPAQAAPLDPQFRPAILANRSFRQQWAGHGAPVRIALERGDGGVSRYDAEVAPESSLHAAGSFVFVERLLKFLLWSRGGRKIYFSGPAALGARLQAHFRDSPTGRFDADVMGRRIYEQPFEVTLVEASQMPPARETSAPLGRHWNGCRIGF